MFNKHQLGKVWEMYEDNKFEALSLSFVVLAVLFLLAVGYLGTIYAL